MTQEAVRRDYRRLAVSDVNAHLTCRLCHGYLIDATTIKRCIHSFCRSCIVRHLQSNGGCPVCHVTVLVPGSDRSKFGSVLRPDRILQALTYKIVPGLYKKEERLRLAFAESHPSESTDCMSSKVVHRRRPIISPDDSISICLRNPAAESRFLLCPAAMTVGTLKQFISVKFSLNQTNQMVQLSVSDNVLEDQQTLMDVIYIERWKQDACLVLDYDVVCRLYTSPVTSTESFILSDASADVNMPRDTSAETSSESIITNESTSAVPVPFSAQTTAVCAPTLCETGGIIATRIETVATPSESKNKKRVGSAVATSTESSISDTMNRSVIRPSSVKTKANSAELLKPALVCTGVSSPARTPALTLAVSSSGSPSCPAVPLSPGTPSGSTVTPNTVLTTQGQSVTPRQHGKRNNSSPNKSGCQKKHCPTSRAYTSASSNSSTSLWTTCARSSATPRVTSVDKSLSPRIPSFNIPPSPTITSSNMSSPSKVTFLTASSLPRVTEFSIPSSPKVTSLNASPQKVSPFSASPLKVSSPRVLSRNRPSSPKNTSLNMSPSKVTSLSRSPTKLTSLEQSPRKNDLNKCSELNSDLSSMIEETKCKFTKLIESNDDCNRIGLSPNKSQNGLSPDKASYGLSSDKSLNKLSSDKSLNGLSPSKSLSGLPSEKSLNGLSPSKSLSGLSFDKSLPPNAVECSSSDGLTISASVTFVINRGLTQQQPQQQQQLQQQQHQQQQLQQQLPTSDVDYSTVTKAKRKQRSLEAIVSALRPKPIPSPSIGVTSTIRHGMTAFADNTANTSDSVNPLHEQNYKLQNASRLEESLQSIKSCPSNSNTVKPETTGKRYVPNEDVGANGSKVPGSVSHIKRFKKMAASSNTYLPRVATSVVSNQQGSNGIYSGIFAEQLTHFTRLQQQQQQHQQQLSYVNRLRAPNVGNINRVGNTNNNANALDSIQSGGRPPMSSQNSVCPPFWFGNNAGGLSQQFLQQHQFQQMLRQQQAMQQHSPATTPSPALSSCSSSSMSSSNQTGRGTNMTPIHPAFALPNGYDAPIELTTQQSRERKEINDRPSTKLSRSHATITALLQRK